MMALVPYMLHAVMGVLFGRNLMTGLLKILMIPPLTLLLSFLLMTLLLLLDCLVG